MKRLISFLLAAVLCTGFSICGFAETVMENETEYFDDGSCIETGFEPDHESDTAGFFAKLLEFFKRIIEFFTGNKTVSKTKYISYYALDGELLWTAKIKADFKCSKNAAVCTDCKFEINIYDSDWRLLSSECEKTQNRAEAHFSVRQYKLAVPLKTIERTLTLTCDTAGNVS